MPHFSQNFPKISRIYNRLIPCYTVNNHRNHRLYILRGTHRQVTFQKPIYAIVAMITCSLLFLAFYFNGRLLENKFMITYERIMLILDAIGLGIFTVVGVSAGMNTPFGDNLFLVVFLGVITGVGGGVIRDMLAIQKPYILVRHVYACASILDAIICALLWPMGDILSMFTGAVVVLIIRLMAMTFKWNLPKLRTTSLKS